MKNLVTWITILNFYVQITNTNWLKKQNGTPQQYYNWVCRRFVLFRKYQKDKGKSMTFWFMKRTLKKALEIHGRPPYKVDLGFKEAEAKYKELLQIPGIVKEISHDLVGKYFTILPNNERLLHSYFVKGERYCEYYENSSSGSTPAWSRNTIKCLNVYLPSERREGILYPERVRGSIKSGWYPLQIRYATDEEIEEYELSKLQFEIEASINWNSCFKATPW